MNNSRLDGSSAESDRLNSLIYFDLTSRPPTRYEMIKYSTWRIYLYNELEGDSFDRRDVKKIF